MKASNHNRQTAKRHAAGRIWARSLSCTLALTAVLLFGVACTKDNMGPGTGTGGTTAGTSASDNKPSSSGKPGDGTASPLDPDAGTVRPDTKPGDPPAGTGKGDVTGKSFRSKLLH